MYIMWVVGHVKWIIGQNFMNYRALISFENILDKNERVLIFCMKIFISHVTYWSEG